MIFKCIFLLGCWTTCTLSLLKVFLETCRSTFLELFPKQLLRALGSLAKNIHLLLCNSLRSPSPPPHQSIRRPSANISEHWNQLELYEFMKAEDVAPTYSYIPWDAGIAPPILWTLVQIRADHQWKLQPVTQHSLLLSAGFLSENKESLICHLKQAAFFTVMKHWDIGIVDKSVIQWDNRQSAILGTSISQTQTRWHIYTQINNITDISQWMRIMKYLFHAAASASDPLKL